MRVGLVQPVAESVDPVLTVQPLTSTQQEQERLNSWWSGHRRCDATAEMGDRQLKLMQWNQPRIQEVWTLG